MGTTTKKCLLSAAAASLGLCLAGPTWGGAKIELDETRSITIGAGLRTQYQNIEDGAENGDDNANDFTLSNIRLYMGGQITDTIKFTFNTEKIANDDLVVLDAIAQFEFSPEFNIWIGRMLTPADRIEMNGPFYSLNWNPFTVPLFPSDQGGQAGRIGRDEGVTVWGTVGKFQYAVGAFDGLEGFSNQEDNLLFAGRFAYNFLNKEDNPAYYTSSTYYGSLGNILTAAVSFQSQDDGTGNTQEADDFSGYVFDLLSETVFDGGGVLTIEAEYKDFDTDFTNNSRPASENQILGGFGSPFIISFDPCFCLFDGDSYFVTAAFMLPGSTGPGKWQPYVRITENDPSDGDDNDLTEIGVNYVIDGHNARLNFNITDGDALGASGFQRPDGEDIRTISIGAQIQI